MNLPTREQVQRAHGAVLKNLREGTTELSQEQLAEESETDQTYVSLQERGKRCPNLWVFLKNAHALNVDPVLMLSMVLARLRDGL
jgi:DNA-binding XRE family transcriptional regulator